MKEYNPETHRLVLVSAVDSRSRTISLDPEDALLIEMAIRKEQVQRGLTYSQAAEMVGQYEELEASRWYTALTTCIEDS